MKTNTKFAVASLMLAAVLNAAAQVASNVTFARITTGAIVTDAAHSFGCAWGDYDGDGYLDLIVGNGLGDANALYHNKGNGTFTRITTNAIATTIGDTDGCVWGDFDNDGKLDLFVANYQLASFLFRNDGGGNFTRIINGSMGSNSRDSVGAAWGDYDKDGFIDLVVANANGQNDYLYRNNNGDGTFTQVFDPPVPTSGGPSFGPRWLDYDLNGTLDLFILSGNTNIENALFQNNGGSFSVASGALSDDVGGGTGDWGDYDNDGDLDLFCSWRNPSGANESVIYRNDGGGVFTRVTFGSIVTGGGSFNVRGIWGDYDNDGWLDLFAVDAAGNFSRLHNNSDGTFTQVIGGGITNNGSHLSGGAAWVDYDNDGFLDLFLACGADNFREPNFLFHNQGNSNRWLTVKCVGAASNRSGIGTKVQVKTVIGGVALSQFREINSGDGYQGSGLRGHFGLGDATNVDLIRIEWPSGTVQELQNVPVNQFLTVTEPARLRLFGPGPCDGRVILLELRGGKGFSYRIDESSNLTDWLPRVSALTVTNQDGTALIGGHCDDWYHPQRFYRAVQLP